MKKLTKIFAMMSILPIAMGSSVIAGAATLDDSAKKAIYIALDDEYKAWSLYNNIIKNHGEVRPFSNIIRAEKHHQSALIELLENYGLSVPANPYEDGTKARPALPDTVLESCKIGVQAEIDNGALYNDKILPAVKKYSDITAVMINLRDASLERHLLAFKRCVSRDGNMGRGGGMGRGHGMGRGGHGRGRGGQ